MRAIADKDRPLGMVHFDAHTDTTDKYFGEKITTPTARRSAAPSRRACSTPSAPSRSVSAGALYGGVDNDWGLERGIRVITIEEFYELGVDAVIAEARRVVGDGATYVSFDVDGLDPVYAPGTGTPEIGGYSTFEAQRMLRGLAGLNLVGGDVVEVAPPFDPSGNTAIVGATMMFEILCILGRCRRPPPRRLARIPLPSKNAHRPAGAGGGKTLG